MLPLLAATGDHSVALELGDFENMILEEKGNKVGKGRGNEEKEGKDKEENGRV